MLKQEYDNLNFYTKFAKEMGKSQQEINESSYVKETKKRIRNWYKRSEEYPEYHYTDEMGESCWYKEWFDNTTVAEVKEYAEEYLWKSINSPYDCTGQRFTAGMSFFQIGNRVLMYHFLGLDV
jgi:hypothetical protein